MKYIFVAGAPGSKWSSVVKNIYYSADIDGSDYSNDRTYHHDASGELELMHLGAYWDPGMEFGDWFDDLSKYDKKTCEKEFDRPFNSTGVRIVKSHVFCNHLEFIKQTWPDCAIVLVHRENDACLGWWVKCGHFDITYPSYAVYYKNLKNMAKTIKTQNAGIVAAQPKYIPGIYLLPKNNVDLCSMLRISAPPAEYKQTYADNDIKVTVL